MKFTKGKRIQLKTLGGGGRNQTLVRIYSPAAYYISTVHVLSSVQHPLLLPGFWRQDVRVYTKHTVPHDGAEVTLGALETLIKIINTRIERKRSGTRTH